MAYFTFLSQHFFVTGDKYNIKTKNSAQNINNFKIHKLSIKQVVYITNSTIMRAHWLITESHRYILGLMDFALQFIRQTYTDIFIKQ